MALTITDHVATQVRQVEKALRATYLDDELLDATDLAGKSAEAREHRLLSRALAAQAVRIVTGFSHAESAVSVIDGDLDKGIDAIAVVAGQQPHVYIVQAKWSFNGRAKSDRETVLEALNGLRLIDDEEFAEFNPRGQQLAELAKNTMSEGMAPVKVTLVFILMRPDEPTDGFLNALHTGEREFNQYGEMLDHRIILASETWESVRLDRAPQPVELTVELLPWFGINAPYESYQGQVPAEQVAAWVELGENLYNLNIRNPLGRTSINNDLIDTLTTEPANFWYYNGAGVTILCESLVNNRPATRMPQKYPLNLTLQNASVVNGAQTVRSVAEALAADDMTAEAQVGVRIIVTGKNTEFAKQITLATNRQNRVEPRDLIALDSVQAAIMEEMRAELSLEYSVKRSELQPHPDTGCSVVEAACALACVHSDSRYAARIATTLDVLWERGTQGIYDVLFRTQPSADLIWNAVTVLREVRRSLHGLRRKYERRGVALIEHGGYLITHLVFRRLDTEGIDEPDSAQWRNKAVDQTATLVEELLPSVAIAIDDLYGERAQVRAVCADAERCREVVDRVLTGTDVVRDVYLRKAVPKKRRRPSAVSVLVDKAVLAEGEPLTLSSPFPGEAEALRDWLAEDPKRARATWVINRSKPIMWAADGKKYSPTGLITHIWEQAKWENRPVANQGTIRWVNNSGKTLADLAWQVLDDLETPDD